MATVQTPAKRPAAVSKHEAFVDSQLRRALGRIHTFDVLAALFGLFVITSIYALVLVLLDAALILPSLIRLVAFGLFVVGVGAYLAVVVARVVRLQVNPYYAAVRLEQALPGAKNSLVNWLDLRENRLPSAIRGAVGQRAARDLSKANVDEAITGRHTLWLGGLTLALFVATVALFTTLGPAQFLSLLRRTFAPFVETPVATRTSLSIVQPEGRDTIVPVGQSVNFRVKVEGRIPHADQPDAVRLLFRYSPSEPDYQERPLVPGDSASDWVYRLPGVEVQNGFYYKIKGGDAETDEFQVQARSGPVLTGFDVTYKHRPYLRRKNETTSDPNLVGWRGTEVVVQARTNRAVKAGRLIIEGGEGIAAQPVADDDHAMRFRLVLEKDGLYRIRFVSSEDEQSGDSVAYTIKVLPDHPPQVALTQPGEDTTLPANGTLPLKGKVTDDFGIADVQLRMRVKEGPTLQALPYLPSRFRYEDGSCPVNHDYQDFLALDKVAQANGASYKAKPGEVIEYWLEATDNCDVPRGQVGKSKVYSITVTKPADPKQQEKDRRQAEEEQKKHQQQTDEKRKDENEQKKKEAEQSKNGQDQSADPQTARQQREDQQNQQTAKDFQDKIDKKKGEGKPEGNPQSPGEQKDQGSQPQGAQEGSSGESKPQPKPADDGQGAGAAKPQPQSGNDSPGQKKDQQQSGSGNSGPEKPNNQSGNDGKSGPGQAKGPQQPESKGEQRLADAGPGKGETHKGDGKTGDSQPGGTKQSAEAKPAKPDQAKTSAEARGDGDANSGELTGNRRAGDGKKDNASMDDVSKLAKDMQNRDPQKKKEAGGALQQIAREAKDAQVRDAAQKALKKYDGQPSSGAGDSNSPTPNSTTSGNAGPNGQPTTETGPEKATAGGKNDVADHPDKRGGPGSPTDRTGDDKTKSGGRNSGTEKGTRANERDASPGNEGRTPGGAAGPGDRPANPKAAPGGPEPGGSQADLANKKRAADLQLEELKKKITPEMLKERNWTQEDLDHWYRAMKDQINRDYQRGLEKLAPPQKGGTGAFHGTGPRRIDASGAAKPDLQNAGKTVAPPDISNAYQKLTEELSKLKSK